MATPILSITYKNNEIFSTSTPGTKIIKTAGKWMEDDLGVTINSGMQITATVTVDTGSTVAATKGSTTVTGTSVNNQCVLTLPYAGTWTLQATLNGDTTGIETITFSNNYPVTLQYVQLISFTIKPFNPDDPIGYYQAEEGMTWGEWVNSAYNTGNLTIQGNYIRPSGGDDVADLTKESYVKTTDTIVANREYQEWSGPM